MLKTNLTHQRERSRAQAMTEFAMVAPILFFLLLGIVESGLLLFVVGSARFGAGEIARQESESGNAANADAISIQQLPAGRNAHRRGDVAFQLSERDQRPERLSWCDAPVQVQVEDRHFHRTDR